MMPVMWRAFWAWYERTYTLNVSIALGLFLLQIWHLIWLGSHVVTERLTGAPLFSLEGLPLLLTIIVDYTEIPAILGVTLVYVDAWRRGEKWNAIIMLTLLHSQWLHMFWITDEFVFNTLIGHGGDGHTHATILPAWLAWVAIGIDYLEVPVMFDLLRRCIRALREKRIGEFLKKELRE